MQLLGDLDQVDHIDELGTAHQPHEDHQEEKHVDVVAEDAKGVDQEECEETSLSNRDYPDTLDLDAG